MTFDATTATPKEFAEFLLANRFKNSAKEAAQFLLQTIDSLPNLEQISELLSGDGDGDDSNNEEIDDDNCAVGSLGKKQTLPSPTGDEDTNNILISATTPRSKFNFCVHENGIILTSPKNEEIVLQSDDVRHVIIFPKREDCVKYPKTTKDGKHIIIPGSLVLLILKHDKVQFRNKMLSQICLQLPQHFSKSIENVDMSELSESQAGLETVCIDDFEEIIMKLCSSALKLDDRIYRVYNPKFHHFCTISSYVFQSDDGGANKSIMQGLMPYLKCYNGVNDGVIYPMEEGLLFFKPPLFIHRSELHSIAVGRGGGSRYVDLHATLDGDDGDNAEIEFTNIDREEMAVLNSYIHNTLVKAMAKDVENDDEKKDDEKMDNIGSTRNEGQQPGRKRSRQASEVARKATKCELEQIAHDDGDEEDKDDDNYEMTRKSDDEESEEEEDYSDDTDASDGTESEAEE